MAHFICPITNIFVSILAKLGVEFWVGLKTPSIATELDIDWLLRPLSTWQAREMILESDPPNLISKEYDKHLLESL